LQWMEGKVPTPNGAIAVKCSTNEMNITTAAGIGTLRFKSAVKPDSKQGTIESKGGNLYELIMQPNKNYTVNYQLSK